MTNAGILKVFLPFFVKAYLLIWHSRVLGHAVQTCKRVDNWEFSEKEGSGQKCKLDKGSKIFSCSGGLVW